MGALKAVGHQARSIPKGDRVNEDEARQLLLEVRDQAAAAQTINRLVEERRREAVLVAVEAEISQAEIARQLGITQSRVNQIINNKR